MAEDYLKVLFDPHTKIWESVNSSTKINHNISIGQQFLNTIRSIDNCKIIDHFYDTNVKKTAQTIYEEAIMIAIEMLNWGIKKNDIVIFYAENNEAIASLTMGTILMGAIPCFFDVALNEEFTWFLLADCEPSTIFYEEKFFHKLEAAMKKTSLKKLTHLIPIDGSSQPNVKSVFQQRDTPCNFAAFESVEIKNPENEIAILVMTSGSTGKPKNVQISHALLLHGMQIWWQNETNFEPINSQSVVFSFSPLRWISQIATIFQATLFGIKRISCNGKATGSYGLQLLSSTDVTHIFVAPSIFYEILLQLAHNDVESLKSLKMIQLGGEPPSPKIVAMSKKHVPNGKAFSCYGMTEMCSCIFNDEFHKGAKILTGYKMQILDDKLQPLGPQQPGQIAILPPVPLLGYRNIDNTQLYNDTGFFINGDYGLMDNEGRLQILGRYKDLIKSKNNNLSPNVLEFYLNQLPGIYVARLAGYKRRPDDLYDTGAIFVVPNCNVNITQKELNDTIREELKKHLTSEDLSIFEDIHNVASIPLTTCGKVDRVALRNLALERFKHDSECK